MKLLLTLAWRSLWRNRRRTIISAASIGLALTISVFFIALANGMYAKMIDQAVRLQAGHLTLEHIEYRDTPSADLVVDGVRAFRERLAALPGVEATKPLVVAQGVAKSGRDSIGVAILGVEPAAELRASPLVVKMIGGAYLAEGDDRAVVVGQDLAQRLGVGVGKKVVLTTNDVSGQLVEELVRVKGIFATRVEEIDGYLVQVPIGFAQRLVGMGPDQATQIGVVLSPPGAEAEVAAVAAGWLSGSRIAVRSWQEVLPDLAAYIRTDGGTNYVVNGLILFLVMFTIFNTVMMSTLERQREFAVLLALGTPTIRIQLQLLAESAMLALLGCALGLGLGGGLAYWSQVEGIDIRHFFEEGVTVSGVMVDFDLRARLTWDLLVGLGAAVLAATLLITLLPMGRVRRIPVADVLR
jgi:predicted ribosomally synthesized peptide with SipW-like signal peptide